MSVLSGEHDGEGAAFTLRTLHLYCAAVSIYNLLYDGQANTGAVDAVRPARRAAHELGKDLGLFTCGGRRVRGRARRLQTDSLRRATWKRETVWLSPEYFDGIIQQVSRAAWPMASASA